MARLLVALIVSLALLASPASAAPTATGTGGAAASVDPYATQTAIDVLRKGGNAVDAAVAAAAVLGVVEPYSSGVGGGGFMVIHTRDGLTQTIDGRETAPAAFTPDAFLENGAPIPFAEAVTSGLGVGVPGTPRTWELALDRYGSRPLPALLQPAIQLARGGFVVDQTLSDQTVANAARFADFPATAALYLPGGTPIQPGQTLRNPDLARTMQLLAHDRFYRGAVADDIVATVQQPPVRPDATRVVRPGRMTTADLANYVAKFRAPTSVDYRGMTVLGMGPPSSGGTTVGEALNILEALGEPAADPAEELHRMIEASRLAYADRGAYLGDPDFISVPVQCLLSQPFAEDRAALITDTAGTSPAAPGACPQVREGRSTTHLTVADKRGTVVSYTFTIEQTGGSGIVVPGRGFLLNNELTDFEFVPGRPNSPAAGKRPRSSMAPTIVLRDGKPVLAVGSPGGASIITTVLQILTNVYERDMTLPDAIADPRVSQRNSPQSEAEPAFLASPVASALAARGHAFRSVAELGAATGIAFEDGGRMTAAAEPVRRGGGSAMVVRGDG